MERFVASATIGRLVKVEEDDVAGTVVVVAAVIDINNIVAWIIKKSYKMMMYDI